MSCLGYIISDVKIKNLKGFVEQVNDVSLADLTKPVLFIGVENARKNIKDFSILKKKYDNSVFWTYKKTEKRVDFEDDINYFYSYIINNISSNINYYYINIYNLKYNKIKKLYNILFSSSKKYIYISNNMIYLLYKNNIILGISLNLLEYIKIKKEKILDKLYSNKNNAICTDISQCIKPIKNEIGNNRYVVPYFMSIM
jgi:hypothetical protein